ncbi:MAG: inositol-phosphate phosphatase [Xanthomonadales bacterium]|nr:inositol-phosphate phosphatase [Xanthomonadales bacterium]
MKAYLDVALEAVAAARDPILAHFRGDYEVELKEDQTPVTIADREAEQAIRGVLRAAFPEHGIYGEEFGKSDRESEYLWLIDPIDGTKSFVRGDGMFSTQLALMHKGRLIVGVSNAPVMDELAWATLGGGAWLAGERLHVSDIGALSEATVSTGNLASLVASGRWGALGEIIAASNRSRGYGDFYHYHRLAAGKLDAVIESDVNVLDIAALSLVVTEAGGVFTDLEGAPVGLHTRSVLAATPALHAQLLQRLS